MISSKIAFFLALIAEFKSLPIQTVDQSVGGCNTKIKDPKCDSDEVHLMKTETNQAVRMNTEYSASNQVSTEIEHPLEAQEVHRVSGLITMNTQNLPSRFPPNRNVANNPLKSNLQFSMQGLTNIEATHGMSTSIANAEKSLSDELKEVSIANKESSISSSSQSQAIRNTLQAKVDPSSKTKVEGKCLNGKVIEAGSKINQNRGSTNTTQTDIAGNSESRFGTILSQVYSTSNIHQNSYDHRVVNDVNSFASEHERNNSNSQIGHSNAYQYKNFTRTNVVNSVNSNSATLSTGFGASSLQNSIIHSNGLTQSLKNPLTTSVHDDGSYRDFQHEQETINTEKTQQNHLMSKIKYSVTPSVIKGTDFGSKKPVPVSSCKRNSGQKLQYESDRLGASSFKSGNIFSLSPLFGSPTEDSDESHQEQLESIGANHKVSRRLLGYEFTKNGNVMVLGEAKKSYPKPRLNGNEIQKYRRLNRKQDNRISSCGQYRARNANHGNYHGNDNNNDFSKVHSRKKQNFKNFKVNNGIEMKLDNTKYINHETRTNSKNFDHKPSKGLGSSTFRKIPVGIPNDISHHRISFVVSKKDLIPFSNDYENHVKSGSTKNMVTELKPEKKRRNSNFGPIQNGAITKDDHRTMPYKGQSSESSMLLLGFRSNIQDNQWFRKGLRKSVKGYSELQPREGRREPVKNKSKGRYSAEINSNYAIGPSHDADIGPKKYGFSLSNVHFLPMKPFTKHKNKILVKRI